MKEVEVEQGRKKRKKNVDGKFPSCSLALAVALTFPKTTSFALRPDRGVVFSLLCPPSRRQERGQQLLQLDSRRDAGESRSRRSRGDRFSVGGIDNDDASNDDDSSPLLCFSSFSLRCSGQFELSTVAWHDLDLCRVHLGQDRGNRWTETLAAAKATSIVTAAKDATNSFLLGGFFGIGGTRRCRSGEARSEA